MQVAGVGRKVAGLITPAGRNTRHPPQIMHAPQTSSRFICGEGSSRRGKTRGLSARVTTGGITQAPAPSAECMQRSSTTTHLAENHVGGCRQVGGGGGVVAAARRRRGCRLGLGHAGCGGLEFGGRDMGTALKGGMGGEITGLVGDLGGGCRGRGLRQEGGAGLRRAPPTPQPHPKPGAPLGARAASMAARPAGVSTKPGPSPT